MNKSPTHQPETAPFPAIYANRTPARPPKHALRPEKPSLILGPFQPCTSCLTSRPDGLAYPSGLLRLIDERKPAYRTAGMLMGTWDPGRHPVISVRRKLPMQPETVAPTPPIVPPAQAAQPPGEPIRPGKTRTAGPPRSSNRQGNPDAAPRRGARARRGGPCRGPAMKSGCCRKQGGGSTGAKTAEGRARIMAAGTIHGLYGAEARAFQAQLSALKRRARGLCTFATAGLSLEAVAPLVRQARTSEPPARRAGSRTGGQAACSPAEHLMRPGTGRGAARVAKRDPSAASAPFRFDAACLSPACSRSAQRTTTRSPTCREKPPTTRYPTAP